MGFDCDFAIASENVDRLDGFFVDILNKLLDWFVEDLSILCGDGRMVFGWEVGNACGAFKLLLFARRLSV